ncbi:UNVERIFIED_CONTAM: hypothetical protein HDU68_007876 [Siphonaria sp. JEL0065]|nr:hypothetical protein HDU68_007876 [Siphonaria sp. JEL0065]
MDSFHDLVRIALLILYLALIGGSVSALRSSRPPVVALSFQDAIVKNEFPGLDAYDQLKNIAQIPHPLGSNENRRSYKYLLDTLNGYKNVSKIEMQVLETTSCAISWKEQIQFDAFLAL